MQNGAIRRLGSPGVIGRWTADAREIRVETEDPELRKAAESVLTTTLVIPVHVEERFEFAGPADALVSTPANVKLLALFALELERLGFEVLPDEE